MRSGQRRRERRRQRCRPPAAWLECDDVGWWSLALHLQEDVIGYVVRSLDQRGRPFQNMAVRQLAQAVTQQRSDSRVMSAKSLISIRLLVWSAPKCTARWLIPRHRQFPQIERCAGESVGEGEPSGMRIDVTHERSVELRAIEGLLEYPSASGSTIVRLTAAPSAMRRAMSARVAASTSSGARSPATNSSRRGRRRAHAERPRRRSRFRAGPASFRCGRSSNQSRPLEHLPRRLRGHLDDLLLLRPGFCGRYHPAPQFCM